MAGKARKIKSPSKEVTATPSMGGSMPETMKMSPGQKKREEQYRVEDAARDVQRYAKIRADRGLHSKALDHIRKESAAIDGLDGGSKDAMPRKAKRITARKASRGGRRR